MMTILQIYCVQRIGPANPHWAIYYFKAIVHNRNQVIIYVKMRFFKPWMFLRNRASNVSIALLANMLLALSRRLYPKIRLCILFINSYYYY